MKQEILILMIAMIGIFAIANPIPIIANAMFNIPVNAIDYLRNAGAFQLNYDCTDLTDDIQNAVACPSITPGVDGTVKIIESANITNFGTMNATTKSWDTDFVLLVGESWHTHDTEDVKAQLTATPKEGSGNYENVATLFYKGYTPARRNFFNKAHKTGTKFAIAVTDEAGTTHVLKKAVCAGTFDTKTSDASEAAGWAVTFKETGEAPIPYTGVFV